MLLLVRTVSLLSGECWSGLRGAPAGMEDEEMSSSAGGGQKVPGGSQELWEGH